MQINSDDDIRNANLCDRDFSHQQLRDCVFTGCEFAGANFRAADLTGSRFIQCQFNDKASERPADFSQARLREVEFSRCNLTVVSLTGCQGYGLQFDHCQMQGSDLCRADFTLPVGDSDLVDLRITHCNLSFANLANTFLRGAILSDCRMLETILDYCDLTDADLSASELHNITATGVTLQGADLRGADFNNLDPRRIDLTGVRIWDSQMWSIIDGLGIVVEAQD